MTMHTCAGADAPLGRRRDQDGDIVDGKGPGGRVTIGVCRYKPILETMAVHNTMVSPEGRITASRSTRSRAAALLLAIALPFWSACSDSPTAPSGSALVTFRVVNETFRVQLIEDDHIQAAREAQQGGPARIPVGRIRSGTNVNAGWSWHLVDVQFAEATIELCDGLPSHVERAGVAFANGYYCPWSAEIIAIQEVP